MTSNALMFCAAPFDRRMLILLNFVVSCLTVSQGTSLMMSRGSKDTETKRRTGNELRINHKAKRRYACCLKTTITSFRWIGESSW